MKDEKIVSVLIIDRPIKKKEHVLLDIINVYRENFYFIIFPPSFSSKLIQVSIFNEDIALVLKKDTLFDIQYEEEDEYHYCDLYHMEESHFFNTLGKIFNFEKFNLTEVENSR